MGNFKQLKVWQYAKNMAIEIYYLVGSNRSMKKDLRFKSQITSAAVSIASNVAEGDELQTQKQSIKHFYIAKGSCAELITQLIIAKEVFQLEEKKVDDLIKNCEYLSLMIFRLIQARK